MLVITFVLSGCTQYFNYNCLKYDTSKIEIIKLIHHGATNGAKLMKELADEEIEELLSGIYFIRNL